MKLRTLMAMLAGMAAVMAGLPVKAQEKPVLPVMTLDSAITGALEQSPVLAASMARAEAAAQGRTQAAALPNPELAVEADNIFGDAPYVRQGIQVQ